MAKEISQTFGGVGDAVSGVLKGVGDVVNGAVQGIGSLAKEIYKSDIGKAIIIAGAIYFGGAALAGGFGTMGTSASFLSGMGAGVSSAATSLQAAWAASSLAPIGSAWSSAYGAGEGLAAAAAAPAAATLSSSAPAALEQSQVAAAAAPPPVAPPPVGAAPGASTVGNYSLGNASVPQITQAGASLPPVNQPWYSKALDFVTPKSELAQYGLINAATSTVGNVISGIGNKQAMEDQQAYETKMLQEKRDYDVQQAKAAQDLRNANMAGQIWDPASQYAGAPAQAPAPAGLARRYMAPSEYTQRFYDRLPANYKQYATA